MLIVVNVFSSLFKLSGGVASFNTINKSFSNNSEVRLFQDVQITWPDLGWIDFYHRFRFEQRFFFYENIDNDLYIRGRYLIRARTANFRLIGKSKSFYIKGMWAY